MGAYGQFVRNISGSGGFIPAGTKFDTIPVLRAGEQACVSDDDMYVMRGLFCGEAVGYVKHLGKLSLGDAIATAKESAGMLRRMAVYEGCVRPEDGGCRRLPVMSYRSFISTKCGNSDKFYRRFTDVLGKLGGVGFPEVQKFDCEALWVLNQAQRYCKNSDDRNVLQRMIPMECQPASNDITSLSEHGTAEDTLVMHRMDLYNHLDEISDRGRFACEMSLSQLSAKYPGNSARAKNAIWTGIQSDKCRMLPDAFLLAWSKTSPTSQARSIAHMVPGNDLDLPVGCLRYTHVAFGKRYQSEIPFYDSDVLSEWSKIAYAEAVKSGTMDKVDVILPKTVSDDDIMPPAFSDFEYDRTYRHRVETERNALSAAARDVSDLNRALADAVSGAGNSMDSDEEEFS